MSENLLGANLEELRALSRDMEHSAQMLRTARAGLISTINGGLQWHGPDAFFFTHAWNSSHAPTLLQAAEMLSGTSLALNRQAAEQENTSSS
ncbi:hypothetical protein [Psychromicrobium xiongbiense]|uniref:hypothetical protein n=1 Tax=Psychromicrobium xiongbiense TaxID=3051184 RepID=UPI0025527B61|nr:hypothetical protein [Psychromicrobium sp. YIM S02556]